MENKNTIFITGANRGIGLALVKEALKKDVVSAASLTNIFHFTEKSLSLIHI